MGNKSRGSAGAQGSSSGVGSGSACRAGSGQPSKERMQLLRIASPAVINRVNKVDDSNVSGYDYESPAE